MRLYHVTTQRALRSIRKVGYLDPDMAKGKLARTWFVPVVKVDWAILHVQARHLARLQDIVILALDLDDGEFSEFAGSCKFFRIDRTPFARVTSVVTSGEWVDRENYDRAGTTSGLVA